MTFLRTSLAIACAALLFTGGVSAQQKMTGNPKAVVHVQEVTTNFQVMSYRYCPVRNDRRFKQNCKQAEAYNFNTSWMSPNTQLFRDGDFKYHAQWQRAKSKGLYAWVSGNHGYTLQYLKEETLLANVQPGTVVIDSLYQFGTKAQKDAVVARVKAAFARKYGAVAKQMTYRMATPAPVKCLKRREAPKDRYNCTLR